MPRSSETAVAIGQAFEWLPPYEADDDISMRLARTTLGQAAVFLSEAQHEIFQTHQPETPLVLFWDSQRPDILTYTEEEYVAFIMGCKNNEFDFLISDAGPQDVQ